MLIRKVWNYLLWRTTTWWHHPGISTGICRSRDNPPQGLTTTMRDCLELLASCIAARLSHAILCFYPKNIHRTTVACGLHNHKAIAHFWQWHWQNYRQTDKSRRCELTWVAFPSFYLWSMLSGGGSLAAAACWRWRSLGLLLQGVKLQRPQRVKSPGDRLLS